MPIFYDRIADQVEELLPEFYQEEGPRFISFLKAYFEFLEKGQLIYKDAADIDYIGLEDGTVAGEAFNTDGQRGNMLQEPGSYAPSSITSAKLNYEYDVDVPPDVGGDVAPQPTSFEMGEYVVGSISGAIGKIEVIGSSSNLYIEQFSEAQFDIDETITGMTSTMTAKVAGFKASPLHAANNLLSYADIDKTSGDFVEYFRRDFMPFIDFSLSPVDIKVNKRLLQKHIKELYLAKGTKESYEFLFRILYGQEAEITFPTENVIRASESEFDQPTVMRVYSTADLTKYVGGQITKYTGATIIAQAWINKSSGVGGTNDGGNAYEIEPILPHKGIFDQGDPVVISDRDGLRIDALGTVRGIMSNIDPTEGSIYVGIEDGTAGDSEDIIRVENPTTIYILNEDGDNILYEDDDSLTFEHALHSEDYDVRPLGLETGTGVGSLLTEESVYDIDENLITDYVLLDENTDFYDGMVTHNPEVILIMESNENIQLEDAYGVLLSNDSQIPDQQWINLQPSVRSMAGGLYGEEASTGSLYVEDESFNYQSPAGGTASQSLNLISSIGRGGITEVIIDDGGIGHGGYSAVSGNTGGVPLATRGYSTGDQLVFLNDGTAGSLASAIVGVTDGNIELESGTTFGIHTYTATAGQTIFQGLSNEGRVLGFDPTKVEVFASNEAGNLTELTRETDFITDQSGQKITLIGNLAVLDTQGVSYTLANSDVVEVIASFRGLALENALRPDRWNVVTQEFEPEPGYVTNEEAGAINKIQITNPGINYKTPPQVFVGGFIYYDTMTTGTTFTVGEVIRESGSNGLMVVVSQDTDKKRILVYKRTTDVAGVPSGTITGLTSASSCTILQTNVTAGGVYGSVQGAKLWAWGDDIGSIKKLEMQNVGHDFDEGGIGNYRQHAIVKSASGALVGATKVTASLTGATGTIHTFDPSKNIVTLKDVKGIFNDGDYCTTDESPSKTFFIAKINPATARGVLQGTSLIGGNFTNDTGFPSVDSQRLHDGKVYQDYSYIIKVGTSINQFRSIVKSLLSPAGSIFFGEMAIRNQIDARATVYKASFGGDDPDTAVMDGPSTRAFVPTLIIGSRMDVADLALEDGTVPGGITRLNQLTLTGTGATGVYTNISPVVHTAGGVPGSGCTVSLQLMSNTTYSNLQIITRGTDYREGDTFTIHQEMVGGTETSPSTPFATFEISEVGSPLETSSHLTFTSSADPIGKIELETGEGVMSTERFLSIEDRYAPILYDSQDPPQAIGYKVFKDQASGIFYSTVPNTPEGAQALIVGTTFEPADRDFFNRYLMAEVSVKGHRVNKRLEIFPAYNQHKIYYSTLNNALAVGTKVRGATSDALGIVMQHDTTNKFIIVHRDQKDWGKAGSQFSGTEIIQNTAASTNYFTGTSIELNWTPEDIVTKREPTAITADTYIPSQAQKTAAEGGGETYTHTTIPAPNPGYVGGWHGRGKTLVLTDHSESYDSEMKQRKVTLISSPLYTSGSTQRRRALSASNNTKTPLNQRAAETYVAGDRSTTRRTTVIVAGDTAQPYLAINGTALRLDDIKNSVSRLPGDSRTSAQVAADTTDGVPNNATYPDIAGGVNWGFRPAGQKLYESTNIISEKLITETGDSIVPEDDHGNIIGEYFGGDGIVLLEDDTEMLFETETILEDTHYFVSEESTQIASYNFVGDNNDRIIDETLSKPIILEEALMVGQKESNQSGPSMGDLGNIMFSENYGIMNKVYEEDFYVLDETDSDNILMEDNTLLVSESDDVMLETGEHMLQESPSEGLRISDISSMYPNRLVSNLERELGRRTNLNHSAVVQTG
jgi:hypothetical protein